MAQAMTSGAGNNGGNDGNGGNGGGKKGDGDKKPKP
tara:strand:+ start:364 stop:471 length:108 start_codon:yes stop_codon:yes gene_type:complete